MDVTVVATRRMLVAALALAWGAGLALAEGNPDGVSRRHNVFENALGGSGFSRAERKRRRTLFGRNWWEDDDVNVTRRGSASRFIGADSDPEGDPGFGMGNLTYVPDRSVPLGGSDIIAARPLAPEPAAVFDALTTNSSTLRVIPEIREAMARHYEAQEFRPLWLSNGTLTPRAAAVLKVLASADAEGLSAANYLPPSLAAFDAPPPDHDADAMANLEIELTALALRYARDASGGRFDPRRLSLYNDVTPPRVKMPVALKVLAWSPFPVEYLLSLHPSLPAYGALKAELAKVRSEARDEIPFEPIPDGAIVKRGKLDPRIGGVRMRLAELGYAGALAAEGDPLILDQGLSALLREFQTASGISATGQLGPKTIAALNGKAPEDLEAKLLDNLERLRWLPRELGRRHVLVNQAAFTVTVMDGASALWQSRVIVGRPMTQTAVFHDEIETVVFNPSWGVPQSIIVNEYLPKLRRDPGYFDRIGFKVISPEGQRVSSSSIDWWGYGGGYAVGVQQPPGSDNALGELKFLFPNQHNIYMHDTPSRELFEKDTRAFSHGCVRVMNPRQFAAVLLGWEAAAVDLETDSGESKSVKLERKVPVHLTYFTAWPGADGKIEYFRDIYERDKTMDEARSALTMAQR